MPESAANDAQLARTSRFSADVLLAGSWYKLRLAIDPSALRMVLGALAALIIDRRFRAAAMWAFAGAALSFFGFIHGTQLGWAMSPQLTLGYVLFGLVCLAAGTQDKSASS